MRGGSATVDELSRAGIEQSDMCELKKNLDRFPGMRAPGHACLAKVTTKSSERAAVEIFSFKIHIFTMKHSQSRTFQNDKVFIWS